MAAVNLPGPIYVSHTRYVPDRISVEIGPRGALFVRAFTRHAEIRYDTDKLCAYNGSGSIGNAFLRAGIHGENYDKRG